MMRWCFIMRCCLVRLCFNKIAPFQRVGSISKGEVSLPGWIKLCGWRKLQYSWTEYTTLFLSKLTSFTPIGFILQPKCHETLLACLSHTLTMSRNVMLCSRPFWYDSRVVSLRSISWNALCTELALTLCYI